MNTKEAKDFLVQQTAEQAALENISLSELEKRMMYFVENDPTSCPDPLALNDEFEAQYDTRQYEAKIGGLLRRAHKRLEKESPAGARIRNWEDAVRTLRKGDHYLPVMLRTGPSDGNWLRGPENRVIRYGGIGVVLFFVAVTLSEIPNLPAWVFALSIIVSLFFCLLALGFLAQEVYRALRKT